MTSVSANEKEAAFGTSDKADRLRRRSTSCRMNYSAVAPPAQSGSLDPQSAFADALARARQVGERLILN